jgi:eukaryotic-like serine/threonine-protein kinase
MTPQVKLVLDAALDLPPERRQAYVAEACACDAELNREVNALLDSHAQADGFLGTPALIAATTPEPRPGQRIGPYDIGEKVAQGGMGAVYRAIRADGHFQQQVALKLVRRGMDTEQVLRHFRNERQILASLAHPNIARLLDGGSTEDGRPYFVMEYIEGSLLDEYCETHKLSIASRLEMFLVICSAVQYAHQRLVVHRDIKPGNILVTSDGQPKLLDFGIAKITASQPASGPMTAADMMTPEYASPEQLRGEPITTASDIYSLGLLLYYLLTGRCPHRSASRAPLEIARLLSEEPEKPSVVAPKPLRRRLAGDLDSIVLKALRKEPEQRYSSVEQFRQRHPAPSGRLASDCEDLPGSTPARSFLVKEALEYLDSLAAEARGDALLQREVAAAYEKVGKVQGNPMFPNLGDTRGALRSYGKSRAIREALVAAEPADHQLRLKLVGLHGQISEILLFAGDTDAAVEDSGKALAIYEALAKDFAQDSKFQKTLVANTYKHAYLLRRKGDLEGSLAKYRHAAELSRGLITANQQDLEGQVHLATSLDGLGLVLTEKGDTAGALDYRRQALAIREQLASADPNNAHYRRQLSFSHHNLALSLVEVGDLTGALQHAREELNLIESLRAADPKEFQARRNLSLAHKEIGDILVRKADIHGALDHYGKALQIDRGLSSADPGNVQALLDLSFSEGKFGFVQSKLGKIQEALVILWKGVRSQEFLLNKDPHNDLLRGYLANSYQPVSKPRFSPWRIAGRIPASTGSLQHAAGGRLRVSAPRKTTGNQPADVAGTLDTGCYLYQAGAVAIPGRR